MVADGQRNRINHLIDHDHDEDFPFNLVDTLDDHQTRVSEHDNYPMTTVQFSG